MKADSKKIEWLLDNATQYSIAKATGVTQSKLSSLKNGRIKLGNISLEVASKLTKYSEEIQKKINK
ncbi:XRE family transcriptional regulator [Streptococcus halichoeri]|nr:XRE family transcriptional regulator [Streptococcus halichoeri]